MVKTEIDVTEQLDVEPAKFFMRRHIRPQYAGRACETVKAAPIPPAIIDGGMPAIGLLTGVMISKFLGRFQQQHGQAAFKFAFFTSSHGFHFLYQVFNVQLCNYYRNFDNNYCQKCQH